MATHTEQSNLWMKSYLINLAANGTTLLCVCVECRVEELGSSLSSGRGTKGLRVAPCSNQPLGSGGKKLKKSESSK
ncbi:hypothetical protein GUJ93_ZPchr0010g10033 [Zizania palustris]|uniref:Uncharacterized protein n=1 Tax=Zizania palustris TaxID=103762 RepID=A0A8J5WDZ9_ZIZPA|nr:hypothetical protein GUJ93_ZPchr0010g10033 [Zizania palustris]